MSVITMTVLFMQGASAFASNTTPYVSNDPLFSEFIEKFPDISLKQRGNLTENQKKLINLQVLKELFEKYDPSFLRQSGLSKIIFVEDAKYFCREVSRKPACVDPAGWAAVGGSELYVVAADSASADLAFLAPLVVVRLNPNDCPQNDTDCITRTYRANNLSVFEAGKLESRRNVALKSSRHVVHHELFHSMDSYSNGRSWRAHSPSEVVNDQNDSGSGFDADIEGFASDYGTTNAIEDRAEIYGHMMSDTEAMIEKSNRDSVVRNKILAIKSYLQSICGRNSNCRIPQIFENFN